MTPYFFGYGSLVNVNTHSYGDTHPATLTGWQRAWVSTDVRDVVFLTACPMVGGMIDGLIAAVPEGDWAALDAREAGYARLASGDAVTHPARAAQVQHYAVPEQNWRPAGADHFILLSYLDVVVQGYLRVFGQDGVARFFDSTQGWETPILDDRNTPRYPRHKTLSRAETALVNDHLAALSAVVKQGH